MTLLQAKNDLFIQLQTEQDNLVEAQLNDNRRGNIAAKILNEYGGPHPRVGKKLIKLILQYIHSNLQQI